MRYLDIAVAAMVGTAALAGLSIWGPGQADGAALRFRTQTALRDSLAAFVDSKGVPWFASTPWAEVCSALSAASNSTFAMSVQAGSASCGPPAPSDATSVRLSFTLASRQVVLSAWSDAAA